MIYDLHSHSTASDGTLAPEELVSLAAEKGVTHLALTDHDTTAGIAKAAHQAMQTNVNLICGVEISVTWQRKTIHILGLNIDPDCDILQTGLTGLQQLREGRARDIAERLEKHGLVNAYEGARKYAKGQLIGRTHFARYLVECGRAASIREVFKKYLVKNRPGHVSCEWAGLDEAVNWINVAGGSAVIAHPARYKLTASKLRNLIGDFKDAGGVGIEVVSGSHAPHECQQMAGYADRHDLYASCGSDYHGPDNPWVDLGKLQDFPGDCRPIWSLWPGH